MPTIKSRLNITLPPEIEFAIRDLAKRDKTSKSSKATELIKIALEVEEDKIWNAIASKRDVKNTKLIPHSKVWK